MRRTVLAVAVATYVAVWLVDRSLVEVRGPSMEPTLGHGDRVLTVPARLARPRPGQVVVAVDPEDAGHLVVKRIASIGSGRVDLRGDNAAASTDSRRWGPVATSAVRRVAVRRWPRLTPLTRLSAGDGGPVPSSR